MKNRIETIIELFYIEHLKVKEIAEELNVSSAYITKIIKKDERYIFEKSFRKKEKFEYIEECKIQLKDNSIINWNKIILLFENFIGGMANE